MLFLLAIQSAMAVVLVQNDVPNVDLTSTNVIIGIVTPLVTLAATWLVKKISSKINGLLTLVIVPVVAGLFTLITQKLLDPGLSWVVQLLLGTASVFLHQVYLYLSGSIEE